MRRDGGDGPGGGSVRAVNGRPLVAGAAAGPLLVLDEPLSFWGGVDPTTGVIRDAHHPQCGTALTGKVAHMARTRGSSSSSSVLAELIRAGLAPAAILLSAPDPIVVLGATVATELYRLVMPVLVVADDAVGAIGQGTWAEISEPGLIAITR